MLNAALQTPEVVTLSWETVISMVAPIVAGGVWVVKWIVGRSDRDRDALLERMDSDRSAADADRVTLKESLHALRDAVQVASGSIEKNEGAVASMVTSQQRIVWTQERILALLERDLMVVTHPKDKEVV